ncbi:MAG TPA: hypothetical protein DC047_02295 [Blastocatellia bacterium]|nr:hypothetical protein [Blastocatellia bacterium]
MRILVVCGAGYVYGKEIVTINLMKDLRERGHEVMSLTSTWNDREFPTRLERLCIPYKRLPLGFISRRLSWSAVLMTLDQLRLLPVLWLGYKRLERKFKPDVVLHSNFHHVFLLWPLVNKSTSVFHVHDVLPQTTFHKYLLKFINLKVKLFLGTSRFVEESLMLGGVPKSKVAHVLSGINIENSNGYSAKESSSTDKTKRLGQPSIGIVGQIGEWKGHDDLIEALSILRNKGLPFVCRVYGTGDAEYISRLKRKIEDLGLTRHVRWEGFVKDRESMFENIDVCVMPSRVNEAFGMVAAEASWFGVPTVATHMGALSEIIKDGETGYLVGVTNVQQLAEKLQLLAESSALRERMGSAAKHYASDYLSSKRMVKEIESILLSVVRENQ